MGNPAVTLLVPGARFEQMRPMGERQARPLLRSTPAAPVPARSLSAATVVSPGAAGEPLRRDLPTRAQRVARHHRAAARAAHARPCVPGADRADRGIERLPGGGARRVRRAAGSRLTPARIDAGPRHVLDRRGEGPLAVLADACAGRRAAVLAVCADATAAAAGLRDRAGGFALISHDALARTPRSRSPTATSSCIDPPTSAGADEADSSPARGYTHLAWGAAELRFAEQMHELEYGLRASLVALYRSLRLAAEGLR